MTWDCLRPSATAPAYGIVKQENLFQKKDKAGLWPLHFGHWNWISFLVKAKIKKIFSHTDLFYWYAFVNNQLLYFREHERIVLVFSNDEGRLVAPSPRPHS